MRRKIITISLILAFLSLNFSSFATTLEEQKKKVEEAKTESQENLDSITSEKNSVQEEVSNLNASISEVQSELSDLEDKISSLDESIKTKEEDLNDKQKLLDERLSAVYMEGNNTYLEALFSGGIINFISNYDMIKQIAEYDNNLIDEVKQAKIELENEKTELEESKAQIEEKKTTLQNQKSEREEKVKALSAEEQAVQAEIEQKETELNKINEAVKAEQKKIEEQQKKASSTKSTTTSSSSTSSSSSSSTSTSSTQGTSGTTTASGSMAWPTRIAHKVNSIYAPGGRSDTSGYVGTAHKGVDIYAPTGTPIYAAQSGTVVYVNYSGYGGGWGLYVVIYHGQDSSGRALYTRYAHASSIASGISVGSKVTTGTVIMYAGNTGASEGAHLHFEVCLNNMYNQVNPCPYLGIPNAKGTY